jgi:hypothetical protein
MHSPRHGHDVTKRMRARCIFWLLTCVYRFCVVTIETRCPISIAQRHWLVICQTCSASVCQLCDRPVVLVVVMSLSGRDIYCVASTRSSYPRSFVLHNAVIITCHNAALLLKIITEPSALYKFLFLSSRIYKRQSQISVVQQSPLEHTFQ